MSTTVRLSKSKYMAGRQCEKRLWLEFHRPDLIEWNDAQTARLAKGTAFGELARELLGPGVLVDLAPTWRPQSRGLRNSSRSPSRRDMSSRPRSSPQRAGPSRRAAAQGRCIRSHRSEVQQQRMKDQYLDDCAVQTWVARGAGIDARRTWVAVADSQFVYVEEGNYDGLLKLQDVSAEVDARQAEVPRLVRRFQKVLREDGPISERERTAANRTSARSWRIARRGGAGPGLSARLLARSPALVQRLADAGYEDLRDVPLSLVPKGKYQRMLKGIRSGKGFVAPELRRQLVACRIRADISTSKPSISSSRAGWERAHSSTSRSSGHAMSKRQRAMSWPAATWTSAAMTHGENLPLR